MTCSNCGEQHFRVGQRTCTECHAAYMRAWRTGRALTPEQRRKAICRAYTKVLIKRGILVRGRCAVCKIEPAQAHHPDYGNPRLVIWLCEAHHRQEHWRLRNAPQFALAAADA